MTSNGHDPAEGLRASTLALVQYVLRLELPAARWEQVAGILATATEAARARDLDGIRKAQDDLMLVSPVRIIKGDGLATSPADQKIFERANVLIEALQSMRPPTEQDTGGNGH
jgi:hypothetical protein